MKPKNDILAEFARSILAYDPETGVLTWKVDRGGRHARPGALAGNMTPPGYIDVMIKGRGYKAHRVAWLIYYGEWPANTLDHIDGNRANNKLSNLRQATQSQNTRNRAWLGYSLHKPTGKYRVYIRIDGKSVYVGGFNTPDEARAAYVTATIKHYGEYSYALSGRAA